MDASALSISAMNNFQTMAGVPGFEPGLSVLEADVLTVDTIPLQRLPITNLRLQIARSPVIPIGNRQLAIGNVYLVSL